MRPIVASMVAFWLAVFATARPMESLQQATPPASPVPSPTATLSSLSGDWAFRARTGEHEIGGSLHFESEGGALASTYIATNGRATPLTNLALNGELISFGISGSLGTWQLSGVVTRDRMSGNFETISGVVPWTATRGGSHPRSLSPLPGRAGSNPSGVLSDEQKARPAQSVAEQDRSADAKAIKKSNTVIIVLLCVVIVGAAVYLVANNANKHGGNGLLRKQTELRDSATPVQYHHPLLRQQFRAR